MFSQTPLGGPAPPKRPPDMSRLKKITRVAVPLSIAAVLAMSLVSGGVYTLSSGKEAVVTRWGRHVRTEKNPGLQFKIPLVEQRDIVDVEGVKRMEFGFRSQEGGETNTVAEEALMLTGEESLVLADWVVQYRIQDSYNYLFKVDNPEKTLRVISESAYRRVVAAHPLDDILTNKKDDMQIEIMRDLQDICNLLEIGLEITAVQLQDATPPEPVRDAFLDVTRAKEDKNAKINEANRYLNEKLPVARGDATAILNDAEGYKQKRVNEATGIAARFSAIEAEYRLQPEIMRTRLYMEMIREVLPLVDRIYFVEPGGSLIEFLPLDGQAPINRTGGGAE